MKFKDLLDEEGQPTRELDKWLHQNIALKMVDDYSVIPFYTTGDFIDPIWGLAKDYLYSCDIRFNDSADSYECSGSVSSDSVPIFANQKTEKLAIAEILFTVNQRQNNE